MQYVLYVIVGIVIYLCGILLSQRIDAVSELIAKHKKQYIVYCCISGVLCLLAMVLLASPPDNPYFWLCLRAEIFLCTFAAVPWIDSYLKIIPNAYILFGLIMRAVLIPFELLFCDEFITDWVSEIIAAAVLVGSSFICRLLIKNALGFGDVKLLLVLGLLLGVDDMVSAMFVILILTAGISITMLLMKKVSMKDEIPMGPAILIGSYLSLCITYYFH